MGMYEGDIKRNPSEDINEKRNAINDKKKLWVGKVVPYIFDSTLSGKSKVICHYSKRICQILKRSRILKKVVQMEFRYDRSFSNVLKKL